MMTEPNRRGEMKMVRFLPRRPARYVGFEKQRVHDSA